MSPAKERVLAVLLHQRTPVTAAAVHWHLRPELPLAEVEWCLESLKAGGWVLRTGEGPDGPNYALTIAARMDLWESYQGDRWSWVKSAPALVLLTCAGWLAVLGLFYLIRGLL